MRSRTHRIRYLIAPLFLAAVLALWVRSYLPRDFYWGSHGGRVFLVFVEGNWNKLLDGEDYRRNWEELWQTLYQNGDPGWRFAGLAYASSSSLQGMGRAVILSVPLAYPATIAAALTAWSVLASRRRRLLDREGACGRCGYDIRGNESGICPECGAPANANR